jgi:aminopeptidase
MMAGMDHDTLLDRYAELALHVGVGLRPGQRLLLRSPVSAAPLARRIAAAAYRAGSPYVHVDWSDEEITKTRFLLAPDDSFEEVPLGRPEAMTGMAERGDAIVSIDAADPELLAEADPQRVATSRAATQRAMKPFSRILMADGAPWTIVAVPTPAWAAKVFPDEDEATATERLWRAIFAATRLDRDDPVAAWREHVATLEARAGVLNERRFRALRFRGPGTDLTVGLADGHVWKGGLSTTDAGQDFVANLPTEEVFTAPHRERVDGTVRAAVPLAYGGRLIDGFTLRFEAGRVTSARAEKGQDVLDRLLATDEGARRLGEVALVSVDSPIHRSGLLFYNTLFDENAASHVALGEAYRFSVEGGTRMSDEEASTAGLNDSLAHVDFMIGTPETDVDGVVAEGDAVAVMRSGRFVI